MGVVLVLVEVMTVVVVVVLTIVLVVTTATTAAEKSGVLRLDALPGPRGHADGRRTEAGDVTLHRLGPLLPLLPRRPTTHRP